jgi:hypothetical protein
MSCDAIMAKATLAVRRRFAFEDGAFAVIRVWAVPAPVPPSRHGYKYSLVYIEDGVRVIGYDNERGKGDHRHWRDVETPYLFVSMQRLLDDFLRDVDLIRMGRDEDQSEA